MKTKISKIGRRGKIGLAILVAVMFIGVASAALLTNYNKVTTTADVSQAVLLDGKDHTEPIENDFDVIGGDCKSSCHWLNNTGNENAPIVFDTLYHPPGGIGITTTYYTPTHYTFQVTVGNQPVDITVTDGECHITWTIDFPLVAPYDEVIEGNGLMTVGLIIAQDGDGNGPSFQIHNNDGTDSNYPYGDWLYSPWGPTINDGWVGWHSGSINIPLDELSCEWASATGERYNEDNPDGIFTITIAKCVLGAEFHWALNLAIGSGFYNTYLTYEQMSYPVGNFNWFDWGTPIVTMSIPNYEPATIMTDLGTGFTLGKYQSKEIIICHSFDIAIVPGIYYITSLFQPGT